jgi:hypothetical protein
LEYKEEVKNKRVMTNCLIMEQVDNCLKNKGVGHYVCFKRGYGKEVKKMGKILSTEKIFLTEKVFHATDFRIS